MRILGIDYGTKKTGLAISDPTETIANPYDVLVTDKSMISEIAKICQKENVGKIVVGLPVDYLGKANPIMLEVENFVADLGDKTGLEIIMENETLSTQQATQEIGRDKMYDARAAAIILNSYLVHK